jgi:hypothetical protein
VLDDPSFSQLQHLSLPQSSKLLLIMLSSFFVLSALLAAPAFAQTPPVSLLVDLPSYKTTGDIKIRQLLPFVQLRKLAPFRFGSTYDVFSNQCVSSSLEVTFSS